MDDKIKLVRERIQELKQLAALTQGFEHRSIRQMIDLNETILILLYGGWTISVSPAPIVPAPATVFHQRIVAPFMDVKN